jgi:hypothetical protein
MEPPMNADSDSVIASEARQSLLYVIPAKPALDP